ncbi:MAG TPA: hypothetical protein VFE33_25730 [Thermoanaerobaculia bacterium]|nr:hypothetical protein [Thermoanaerobaculia bacterium]
MLQPWFPPMAKLGTILLLFAVLLVAFDLVLVRWLKLGKQAWKRVDYLWLSFAALGLLGAVSQARIYAAGSQLSQYHARAAMRYEDFRQLVIMLAAKPGAVCRTFTPSEHSPVTDTFLRVQREYDQACYWVSDLAGRLPAQPSDPAAPMSPNSLGARPQATIGDLKDIIDGVYRQLGYYNRDAAVVSNLAGQTQRSEAENRLIWPPHFGLR